MARALRISPSTLRRYIRDYGGHIDAVRDGRQLMVAVSSVPTLAQIRDLRARKCRRDDIQRMLSGLPGPATFAGLSDSIDAAVDRAVKKAIDAAHGDLRDELAAIKRTTRDSEVIMRQSLANILFLIDRVGKELQFHLSEERIASNERDLCLTHSGHEVERRAGQRTGDRGVLSMVAAFYRRLFGSVFTRS